MESVANSSNDKDGELPPEFIRPESEQPRLTTFQGAAAEVPVVDFGVGDWETQVKTVCEASKEWGLFQIVNHSVSGEVIENLQRVGRQFFELPKEDKMAYAKDPESKNIDGYGSRLRNGWVDHLFNKIWPPSAIDYRFWPKNPPDYRYYYFPSSFLLVCFIILYLKYNIQKNKLIEIGTERVLSCIALLIIWQGGNGSVRKESA